MAPLAERLGAVGPGAEPGRGEVEVALGHRLAVRAHARGRALPVEETRAPGAGGRGGSFPSRRGRGREPEKFLRETGLVCRAEALRWVAQQLLEYGRCTEADL